MPLTATAIPDTSSGEPYRYEERSTFTGGLNLRADQFNMDPDESPDLLNVDVDPRGGVSRRNGIDVLNVTALSGHVQSLLTHHETDGTESVLVTPLNSAGTATELWYNTGTGDFTQVATGSGNVTFDTTQVPVGLTFNDATYVTNGLPMLSETTKSVVKWTGANDATTLTPDTDGSDGHFPAARYSAAWGEYAWAGHLVEGVTTYANRIRFSKVNDAENWTNTDYIDIDIGEDGDVITGLLADGDRLLVFKADSIYAVYGFDRDTFEVQNVTRAAGCLQGSNPVVTTVGVFFWYSDNGIYLLQGNQAIWAFDRLKPALDNGAMSTDTAPRLMWFDERLWVSVDYIASNTTAGANQVDRRNVFVWDPTLGDRGAWTRYDINVRDMTVHHIDHKHYGMGVTSEWSGTAAFTRGAKFNQNVDVDDYNGTTSSEIFSHYQTGWFSGNRPTFPKRWGKTRTVMLADNTTTVKMTIYKDYNLGTAVVTRSKTITGQDLSAEWDSAVWGTDSWSTGAETNIYEFFRWPTAGTAKAISLRFSVTPTSGFRGKWGLTSVVGMYRTRRIR